MREAQQGNANSYVRLLQKLTPLIRGTVRGARGFAGKTEVEDLVQDILLSVHVARSSYDPSRPFKPWLAAIIRYRLADGARRHASVSSREDALDDIALEEPATPLTLEEQAEAREQVRFLREAVQALPGNQKLAIELLKLQELSLKEAEVLSGMSVGALKVATHRALATLRRFLGTAQT
ncbi:MAG TPA: sigma-70 family RNA polymerase sigma factor [Hyphomicrobiales bacterium]|nr:sigma-70 family RNA polymerase sigma factor [Hyphomicrobiales bacterium]